MLEMWTYGFAVDHDWNFEWELLFHLGDGVFKAFALGRARCIITLSSIDSE